MPTNRANSTHGPLPIFLSVRLSHRRFPRITTNISTIKTRTIIIEFCFKSQIFRHPSLFAISHCLIDFSIANIDKLLIRLADRQSFLTDKFIFGRRIIFKAANRILIALVFGKQGCFIFTIKQAHVIRKTIIVIIRTPEKSFSVGTKFTIEIFGPT